MTKRGRSLYDEITKKIIEQLKEGVAPWVRPWRPRRRGAFPRNATTEAPYQGMNIVMLWLVVRANGYERDRWLTYRQALKAGGHVRKGEKGTSLLRWVVERVEDPSKPDGVRRKAFPKWFSVFNVEQCEGLSPKVMGSKADVEDEEAGLSETERLAAAEDFLAGLGATVIDGGDKAFYRPGDDVIGLPPFKSFDGPEHYYCTYAHEATHWTKHPTRLNRSLSYPLEELVAEIGAAFSCAYLGVTGQLRHAEYIQSWLEVLEEDQGAIFKAAGLAQKAHNYLVKVSTNEVRS